MPAPLAVLFDFDGVLADSENVHVAAWERTFESMGLDISPEECTRSAETDDLSFLTDILRQHEMTGDVDGWVARKQALTVAMLADEPRIYPGVGPLVAWLAPRVKLGVVSSACRAVLLGTLGSTGLLPYFQVLVCREEVTRPKPHPEPYLTAVSRLGVPAGSVVALEDSPGGIASASAAGLRCLAVGHRRPRGPWCEGRPYVPSLAIDPTELAEHIGLVKST